MEKLSRENLYSLEKYSEIRNEFRNKVMAHKNNRRVMLGEHLVLLFEDEMTMRYQVQEMLRIEKIFEAEGIEEELSTYNPMIPDGSNLKATMMIEYSDLEQRKQALAKLLKIEDQVWVKVDGFDEVYAIADEDLERDTEEKTSAVHFLRFEFNDQMIAAIQNSAAISMGVTHTEYTHKINPLAENIRSSLSQDFH